MWYLLTSTGKRLYLQPTKEVTFGRKKSDILLQNDESISRLHATMCVKPKDTVKLNEPISICELKDSGSKYGTYIILNNEAKMEVTKEGYNLKNGDKIRFGLQQHVFTVVYVPIITIVSSFNDIEKKKLQDIFDEIDGMISDEWTSVCTHLTVSKAALTEKIVWAMASAIPIVSLNYWVAVKCAINNGEELPKPTDFVPPLAESLINNGLVSLSINEKRKTLFRNLIFVHFSVRQYKIFGRMINMAGGKSLLYSKKPLTTKEICAPNVIVLKYNDGDTTQSTQGIVPEYETIYNSLQKNKRNMITESDIVLAILHCSTEKYCNPKFMFDKLLKRSQLKPDSSKVLVLDTQDLMSDVRILPKVISNVPITSNVNMKNLTPKVGIIPESCDPCISAASTSQLLDIMKSSSPKGIQITKISNSDITIERKSLENIEEMHSKEIIIPETNDSSQSQDIISTPKINQDTKSTHNSNISIESKLVQGIKEVHPQRRLQCIPETNDSSQSQDIISTPKINQDTKSTHNSDISIESKFPQRIKEVHPQRRLQCIPETNDSSQSQEILTNEKSNTSQNAKNSTNSNTSIGRKPTERIEEVHLRRTPKRIPETNQSSPRKSPLVRNGNRNSHENDHMAELMIVNKETPLNDVIDLVDEVDDEEEAENKLEEILFSKQKASQCVVNFLDQSKLDQLVHDNSIRAHSPDLNIPQRLVSRANYDDSKKSRKRSHSSDEFTDDEDCQTSTRKRLCAETSVTKNPLTLSETVHSALIVKPLRAENHNLSQNNTSSSSPLLKCKIFEKVLRTLPPRRVQFQVVYNCNEVPLPNA